jgi:alkylation response protein AidB-like acyl-CoA dehydrogenase
MQTLTDPGIHFELSEEQKAVRDAARDFAQNVLKPGVIERDREQKFPAAEVIKQLGELGFLGMMVSPKYGGGGMDAISYVLAMEEISKIDASCSVVMSVNNSLVCWGLEEFGNEEQKQKYLVPLAKGEVIGASASASPRPAATPPASAPPPSTWATITCSTAPRTGSPTAAPPAPTW